MIGLPTAALVCLGLHLFVSAVPADSLPDDTLAYWQVEATDVAQNSSVSDVFTCQYISFVCGDVDGDGSNPNVADLTYLVGHLFGGSSPPPVYEAANVDGDNGVNVADLTYLVDYLFAGGSAPIC